MAKRVLKDGAALARGDALARKACAGSRTAGDSTASATLMIDGVHYVVAGALAPELRELLAPYIHRARRR